MGKMRNAYKTLVRKLEEKIPHGRPSHRWEDNIRIDFIEIGWEVVDWIHLALGSDQWQALVSNVMNLRLFIYSSSLHMEHRASTVPCHLILFAASLFASFC
jgi:hypothetical protein